MLVLRLCSVIVDSQHVVQVHDFMKTVWPQAYA